MVKQSNSVKQFSEKDLLAKTRTALEALMSEIPFVEIKEAKTEVSISGREVDLLINALVSRKPVKFVVEVKSQGEPRLIRAATAQMNASLKSLPDSYGIVAAPYISDAGRHICKEMGVGCIDLAGNVFLAFQNIFVDRSGRSNPYSVPRASKSIFSPKSSRILRVLLPDPSKGWYVEDMAAEAGISIGLASRVKQALLSQEWGREDNRKLYIVRPEEMLNQWGNNYSYDKNQVFEFYSGLSSDELDAAIKHECEKKRWRYALALFSGARKVAPFVRFMKSFVYIDGDVDEIADALQMKKVETGANVALLQPYDDGVFYGMQDINGINVVSDIQLYLDLMSYRGRGEEAAKTIFEQRIKPKW